MTRNMQLLGLFAAIVLAVLPFGQGAIAQTFVPTELADQRKWNSIADLLRAVEATYPRTSDRRDATEAVSAMQIDDMLAWTNEAGALLMVPLQQPETVTEGSSEGLVRLGVPVIIGVGATPLDAACAGLSPGPLLAEIQPGMRYAMEHSRFVWVSREGSRLRFRHLTIPESRTLRAREARIVADSVEISAIQGSRLRRIISGVAAYTQQQSRQEVVPTAVEEARSGFDRARIALDNARRSQANWRIWGAKSAYAHDLVSQYQTVIIFRELRSQARALTIPALGDEIRATRSAFDLQVVLGNHREIMRKRLSGLDIPQLCQAELEAYDRFIQSLALGTDLEDFMQRILPGRSGLACLPANS
jgi:hypothetical protein